MGVPALLRLEGALAPIRMGMAVSWSVRILLWRGGVHGDWDIVAGWPWRWCWRLHLLVWGPDGIGWLGRYWRTCRGRRSISSSIAALVIWGQRRRRTSTGFWLVDRELAGLSGWCVGRSSQQVGHILVSIKVVLDVGRNLVGCDISSVSAQPPDMGCYLQDPGCRRGWGNDVMDISGTSPSFSDLSWLSWHQAGDQVPHYITHLILGCALVGSCIPVDGSIFLSKMALYIA